MFEFEFVDDNIVCPKCGTVMYVTCKCDIELIYDCYCWCCDYGYQYTV